MNKFLIILLSLGFTFGASAQKIGDANRRSLSSGSGSVAPSTKVRSNVVVVAPVYRVNPYMGMGFGRMGYSRFGYGFGYSPFYDPFYNPYQRVQEQPTELDLAIEDIKEEYEYKIDVVKDDKSLEKSERKQKVRDLKHQREDAIIEAKKLYYQKKDQNKKDQE